MTEYRYLHTCAGCGRRVPVPGSGYIHHCSTRWDAKDILREEDHSDMSNQNTGAIRYFTCSGCGERIKMRERCGSDARALLNDAQIKMAAWRQAYTPWSERNKRDRRLVATGTEGVAVALNHPVIFTAGIFLVGLGLGVLL